MVVACTAAADERDGHSSSAPARPDTGGGEQEAADQEARLSSFVPACELEQSAKHAKASVQEEEAVAAPSVDRRTVVSKLMQHLNADKTGSDQPGLTRQVSEDDSAQVWNIDGSQGHYHHKPSLCLVMYAQITYIVSLVIIIPTAGDYAASLGNASTVYFGLVIGISSLIDPVVSRMWTSVIRATSLNTVLLSNAAINLVCSLMYVLASVVGGAPLLLASRCLLGLGSVQTAKLQYLGCAVSSKRVTFAHFLTTAAISYGFAFGTLMAFFLSFVASYRSWDQNTLPGWFTALLWLTYIPLHRLVFVEPDKQAGIVDPESRIRLNKEMRPKMRREPFRGLVPCFVAIFVVAVVKGAFEVMTIEITKELWKWEVMGSALFLGAVMLVVSLTTLLAYVLQKRLGEGRIFLFGLIGATLLLPFYYIPVSSRLQAEMGSTLGMAIYLLVSILALSSLNLGRTIAFSLTTELPSPHWRRYFLSLASQIFTMARGVGPILEGALNDKQTTVTVLTAGCLVATLGVAAAFFAGALQHQDHEVGPARAEEEDEENIASFVASMGLWMERVGKMEGGEGTARTTSTGDVLKASPPVPGPRLLGQGTAVTKKCEAMAFGDAI